MKLTNKKAWILLINWLRKEFPAAFPIVTRSIEINRLCGDADLISIGDEPSHFLIRINRKKSFDIRADTLLHEWAHCLTWLGAGQDDDHSAEWGISHARIYRNYLKWDFGRKYKERR